MKIAHKPEVLLTLLFLVLSLLWFCFRLPLVDLIMQQGGELYLSTISKYQSLVFTLGMAAFVFFGVRFFTLRLEKSRNQYYNLFVNHPVPMAVVDPQTQKIIAVNNASSDFYGYSNKELCSMSLPDIRVPLEASDTTQTSEPHNPYFKKTGVRTHKKKNGEIVTVEISSSEIVFKSKNCRLLFVHNITEMVKAKEEKRIAEEEKTQQEIFTAFVLQNFPVDVAVFDKNHRYILLNKTAVKNDEMRNWMIGKDDFDYFERKGANKQIAEKRRELFLKAIEGESTEWIDEHVVDGQLKYVLRKFFPYWEDGQIKYVYGYGTDITELRKAQMEKDTYLEQLEKIAFATSHKIRQPICNLQGLISILELGELECNERQKILEAMQISITNMDECTRDLAIKLHEYKQKLSPGTGKQPEPENNYMFAKEKTENKNIRHKLSNSKTT